jgi:hypothetical protein
MKAGFIIISLLFSLCGFHHNKINYSIEIYLLKNITPKLSNGIPVEFTIRKSDLPELPFIKDDEIESFDTSSYKIQFNKDAAKRIGNLNPDLQVGIPFVLCVDRQPILTGYICNSVSSFSCNSYALINFKTNTQILIKGIPVRQYEKNILERRKNLFFVQALERTGRLK